MKEATALRLVDVSSEMKVHSLMDRVNSMMIGLTGRNVSERADVISQEVAALIKEEGDGAILPCIAMRITDHKLQSAFLENIGALLV